MRYVSARSLVDLGPRAAAFGVWTGVLSGLCSVPLGTVGAQMTLGFLATLIGPIVEELIRWGLSIPTLLALVAFAAWLHLREPRWRRRLLLTIAHVVAMSLGKTLTIAALWNPAWLIEGVRTLILWLIIECANTLVLVAGVSFLSLVMRWIGPAVRPYTGIECLTCGYDRRAQSPAEPCPECGVISVRKPESPARGRWIASIAIVVFAVTAYVWRTGVAWSAATAERLRTNVTEADTFGAPMLLPLADPRPGTWPYTLVPASCRLIRIPGVNDSAMLYAVPYAKGPVAAELLLCKLDRNGLMAAPGSIWIYCILDEEEKARLDPAILQRAAVNLYEEGLRRGWTSAPPGVGPGSAEEVDSAEVLDWPTDRSARGHGLPCGHIIERPCSACSSRSVVHSVARTPAPLHHRHPRSHRMRPTAVTRFFLHPKSIKFDPPLRRTASSW